MSNQVVTCSGICKDGSLRVIRNGIGIDETATIELPGMKGMWSLKRFSTTDSYHHYLIVTFIAETRVLAMCYNSSGDNNNIDDEQVDADEDDYELDEVYIDGLESNDMSLLCGNCDHEQIVQVTSTSVRLIKMERDSQAGPGGRDKSRLVAEWRPSTSSSMASNGGRDTGSNTVINLASMNDTQIILATGAGTIVLLEIGNGALTEIGTRRMPAEVACVHIQRTPLIPTMPFLSPATPSSSLPLYAAVGLWSNDAHLVTIPSLTTITSVHLGIGNAENGNSTEDNTNNSNKNANSTSNLSGDNGSDQQKMVGIIPRSILICTLEDVNYLLCALGDGHLFSFTIDIVAANQSSQFQCETTLKNRKCVLLGSQPITLSEFSASQHPTNASTQTTASATMDSTPAHATESSLKAMNIFASSDRPAVIHSSNKKLLYSNVNMHEITMMCPFHCRYVLFFN